MLQLNDMTLNELLGAISAKTPVPGGGAVAAVTAALAAAVEQMALNYSIGKKLLAEHDHAHRAALMQSQQALAQAMQLAEADAQAYAAMNALWKLAADDPRRAKELPNAVRNAIAPPKELLDSMHDLLATLNHLAGTTNPNLNSDLAIAAILAEAAARSAAWNVRINLPLLHDEQERLALTTTVNQTLADVRSLCADVEQKCAVSD